MSRRLIMLRHGQTIHNATRRMQGHLDTSLSEQGWEGARQVADCLRAAGISRIVSSDLSRAADTAGVVADLIGVDLQIDARLRETDLGQWQDLGHAEVDEKFPGARAAWRHDAKWAPPGGESRIDVARRARPVIDELMTSFPEWEGSTVLVVAHGGTISALTGSLLGFSPDMYPMLSTLNNTHCAVLTARPTYTPGSADALDDPRFETAAARFDPGAPVDAQWYLDGWNLGAVEL